MRVALTLAHLLNAAAAHGAAAAWPCQAMPVHMVAAHAVFRPIGKPSVADSHVYDLNGTAQERLFRIKRFNVFGLRMDHELELENEHNAAAPAMQSARMGAGYSSMSQLRQPNESWSLPLHGHSGLSQTETASPPDSALQFLMAVVIFCCTRLLLCATARGWPRNS